MFREHFFWYLLAIKISNINRQDSHRNWFKKIIFDYAPLCALLELEINFKCVYVTATQGKSRSKSGKEVKRT